jgi:hypothetical protein
MKNSQLKDLLSKLENKSEMQDTQIEEFVELGQKCEYLVG